MSQLDKEMADILEVCLYKRDYLNGTNWMCRVVGTYFLERGLFGSDTYEEISKRIYASMDDAIFLMAYLMITGKVQRGTQYESSEYRKAAHAHWEQLIQELRSQP